MSLRVNWINRVLAVQYDEGKNAGFQPKEEEVSRISHDYRWRYDDYFPPLIPRPQYNFFSGWKIEAHLHPAETEAEKKEKKKQEEISLAKRFGVPVFIGAMAWLGYALRNSMRQNKVVGKAENILLKVTELTESPMKHEIQRLFSNKVNIEKILRGKLRHYFFSALGLAAGSGMVILGAYTEIIKVIRIGTLLSIAAAAGGGLAFCYHLGDEQEIQRLRTKILGNKNIILDGSPKSMRRSMGLANFILGQLRCHYREDMVFEEGIQVRNYRADHYQLFPEIYTHPITHPLHPLRHTRMQPASSAFRNI